MTSSPSLPISPAYFEAMFADSDDPWRFKSRWYEARKRALTLAMLPRQRYASAFEPGCANGELSAALATRCDRLLISDGTPRAVDVARQRVQSLPHVAVIQAWVPGQWPAETFDLIVISELGYFLQPEALDTLIDKVRTSLRPGATVLACHWRRSIEGCVLGGDDVHARIADRLDMPHQAGFRDADFVLDVWCTDARSVAQVEQIA
ncbi:SAM-dependent methyltransferase [Polaromonas sp.]|uniref:SAM-dependent methyltransferase n=1 Tax=Polaromonas sp. TaxID=1869339 RepID=UPI002C53DCD9|nr:SAM-dependent methyltransferase [Polaromonas sp.]HQS32188.1 SAM-dependent methyltransferase [Polaromonas sp.]HQS92486.1 SAM-dependent methyltransferase [Polaromonas sp.]